ncbi:MAG: alpha/beta hydrolase [Devosia sp.]
MTTPFLLIPGLNCDARVYSHATQVLWPFGPVTIANHQTGNSVGAMAEAILTVAPERFALGGFSMGGYVAFEILRQAPQRVLKLALIDTTARPDAAEATENRRRNSALVQGGKFSAVIEQSFPTSFHPDHVMDADFYSIHRAMSASNGPEIYVQHQQAIMARPDSRPDLARITIPTQIIVGEGDQVTPPEMAKEMHEGVSGSRLAIIPRAGHMSLIEQPDLVNAALKEWAAA